MTSSYHLLFHTRAGKKRLRTPFAANQDRALVRAFTTSETGRAVNAALIAVADGVSRCPDGGAVAEWISEKLRTAPLFGHPLTDLGGQLHNRLQEFHQEYLECFRENVAMLESGCTLAAVLLYGSRAMAVWSGDSPLYHLRSQHERFYSQDLIVADKDPYSGALTDCFSGVTPFSLRHRILHLEPGDIVIAATDGITFSGNYLAGGITEQGFSEAWMESVCKNSFEAPRSDDLAIAAARWLGPA